MYKLVVSDPETGKTYQMELDENKSKIMLSQNLRLGSEFDATIYGLKGYILKITGASDKCGFPAKKGVFKKRARILVGEGRERRRKTFVGERIDEDIVQINTKVIKKGDVPLEEIFGKKGST
ncbi:MAG: S6e family ribosomal protein [Candidatus Altarchaeaceae archaeon]